MNEQGKLFARHGAETMDKLTIIWEDADMILCHKLAGIAVQTRRLGEQDMESLLKNYRVKKKEEPYIGIVHRLDQPVEGIMVFAKHSKAAANLSKQVQQHTIGKYYYALSESIPNAKTGILEDYLVTDKKTNYTKVATANETGAKYAKLEYKVLGTREKRTLFDIHLYTGRQHQIRVQMAHMGCPILGDSKYGTKQSTEGLALCSYRLVFLHPSTGKALDFCITPSFLEKDIADAYPHLDFF